jgi:anti-anti-sigma regulatory factor
VYAPVPQPQPSPVVLRLIGVLDAELVEAFVALERGLVGRRGATVLVDVRDVQLLGEAEVKGVVGAIKTARAEGRDVRLDGRGLTWRRAVKQQLSAQPLIDAQLRSSAGRTVILAHSGKHKRS